MKKRIVKIRGKRRRIYLIELKTGKIIFTELNTTVSPLLQYADFISHFPKDKIIQIRDMKNGYIWYDIREKLYDNKIPVQLCFNPQKTLEFVELYPQSFDLNIIRHWENWTLEEVEKDKKYCDAWLMKFCGLQSEENLFSWGSISSYLDPRSGGRGICIHYTERS